MSKKHNIYFISYFYPPVKAVGTLRNYYLSHLFSKYGYDVSVYGGYPLGYRNYEDFEISDDIKYKRTFALDYHIFDFYIAKQRRRNSKISHTTGPSFKSYFPFNILIGEGGFFYIFINLFRLIFQIRKIDILWTSYSPYSDLFIASILKMIKPSIFWVTDWRDVDIDIDWPDNKRTEREKKINNFFFKRCNLVVSVSNGYLKHTKKYADHSYLLRNGILDLNTNMKPLSAEKFSLTYVGGLYGGRRNPEPIFKAIAHHVKDGLISKQDIELNYAGSEGNLYKELSKKWGLDECIIDHGMVTFEKSQELQRNSSMNLMITWSTDAMGTFPAKFFEYINSGRPILLLILGSADQEFDTIFDASEIGSLVYDKDESIIEEEVKSILTQWKSGVLHASTAMEEREKYSLDNSFRIFENELLGHINSTQ